MKNILGLMEKNTPNRLTQKFSKKFGLDAKKGPENRPNFLGWFLGHFLSVFSTFGAGFRQLTYPQPSPTRTQGYLEEDQRRCLLLAKYFLV